MNILTEEIFNDTLAKGPRKLTTNQFFNALDRQKAYQLVTEYKMENVAVSPPEIAYNQLDNVINEEDSLYTRQVVQVKYLKSPNKEYLRELLNALEEPITLTGITPKKAVQKAMKIYHERFGQGYPKQLFFVKLPTGRYILTDLNSETLRIKLMAPEFGCLIVFMPNRVVHFNYVKGA